MGNYRKTPEVGPGSKTEPAAFAPQRGGAVREEGSGLWILIAIAWVLLGVAISSGESGWRYRLTQPEKIIARAAESPSETPAPFGG